MINEMSHIKKYYDKKETKLKEEYITYDDNCLYKSYYETGELYEKYNYINGLKEGSCKLYHINVIIKEECNN